MDVFPGAGLFSGLASHRKVSGASFVGQATFNGCIAFTNWARQDVEQLLPPELELAANTSSTPQLHPVVFIFGEQTEGATLFGGFTVHLGVAYHEFCMAVPFVKHRHGAYLHTFIARMYSSYFPATWNGNAYYGFSKEMARMRWQGPVFLISTEEGPVLLHAAVESDGGWSQGSSCELPNFASMQAVFSLPVVGRKATGTHVCSYFSWDFSDALVRPANSCVSIDAPILGGLTPRRCHAVPSGTFEVRGLLWRLTWPLSCRF